MTNKVQVLRLYKDLIREAGKFNSYYYKNYFTRKVKTQFRKHINTDQVTSEKFLVKSQDMLSMLRRQTLITNLYNESKLVIEDSLEKQESKIKS